MPCFVKSFKASGTRVVLGEGRPQGVETVKPAMSTSDGEVSPCQLDREIGAMRLWLNVIHANILEEDQKTKSLLVKRRMEAMKKLVEDGKKLVKNATNSSPGLRKTLINIHKTIVTNANTFKATSLLAPPVYAEGEITADVRKTGRLLTAYRTLVERYRIWKGRRLRKAGLKKTRSDLTRLARKRIPPRKPKKGSYLHRNLVERMSCRAHGSRIKVKGIVRTKLATLSEEDKESPRREAVSVHTSKPKEESLEGTCSTPLQSPREPRVHIAETSDSEAAKVSRPTVNVKTTIESEDRSANIQMDVRKEGTEYKSQPASPELRDKNPSISPRSPRRSPRSPSISPRSPRSLLESDTDVLATCPRPPGMLPPLQKSPMPRRKKKVLEDVFNDDLGLKAQWLSVSLPPIKQSPETSPIESSAQQSTPNSTTPQFTEYAVEGSRGSLARCETSTTEVARQDEPSSADPHSSSTVKPTNGKPRKKDPFLVEVWQRVKMLFWGK